MPCVGIERPLPPTPNSESLPPTEIQALHLGLLHGASTRREIPGPSLPPSVSLSAPGHQQHPLPCDNLHLCFPYQAESIPEAHLTLQPWAPVGSRLIGHGKRLGLLSSSSDLLRCPLNRKKVPLQVHLLHSIPTHCPQFRAYFHPGDPGAPHPHPPDRILSLPSGLSTSRPTAALMSKAISTSSRMLSWSQRKRETRRCVFSHTMTYPSNDYLSSQIHLVNYTFE